MKRIARMFRALRAISPILLFAFALSLTLRPIPGWTSDRNEQVDRDEPEQERVLPWETTLEDRQIAHQARAAG